MLVLRAHKSANSEEICCTCSVWLLWLLYKKKICIIDWVMYDLSRVRRVYIEGESGFVSYPLYCSHICIIICRKRQRRHFLCPLCSDQSSASSHETITAVCLRVYVCAGLMAFVCLSCSLWWRLQSITQKVWERDTRIKTKWTVFPRPTVKCLSLDPKCLDDLCLD